jgi:hypothetical protein
LKEYDVGYPPDALQVNMLLYRSTNTSGRSKWQQIKYIYHIFRVRIYCSRLVIIDPFLCTYSHIRGSLKHITTHYAICNIS